MDRHPPPAWSGGAGVNLADEALRYVERGWAVFPIRGKQPFAGTKGVHDASSDLDVVEAAWERRGADANIGLGCGEASGVWVLDVDDGEEGLVELDALEEQHGHLPRTLRARTGGGGLHLFWRLGPGQAWPKNRVRRWAKHLDVRSTGGYVVLPPSVHPDTGRRYEWLTQHEPAVAPDWLLELIASPPAAERALPLAVRSAERAPAPVDEDEDDGSARVARSALDGACEDIRQAGRGQAAHGVLFAKARKLGGYVGAGLLDRDDVEARLVDAALAVGREERTVRRAVSQALDAGAEKPIRPVVSNARMTREEALAWWVSHLAASSSDAAMATGVPANQLRKWVAAGRSQDPEQDPPLRRRVPEQDPPKGGGAPEQDPPKGGGAPEQDPRNRSRQGGPAPEQDPRNGLLRGSRSADQDLPGRRGARDQDPRNRSRQGPDPEASDVDAQLVHLRDQVALAESGAKLDLLQRAVYDEALIEALVERRRFDSAAATAELLKLRASCRGAGRFVDIIEERVSDRLSERITRLDDDDSVLEDVGPNDRPIIVIRASMRQVIDEAIGALESASNLYQRGSSLVHVCRDGRDPDLDLEVETPIIRRLSFTRLMELMSTTARWTRRKRGEGGVSYDPCLPVDWAVRGVLERDGWPFPVLRGISEIPAYRLDGSLWTNRGYDQVSGYYCEIASKLDIDVPERPTQRDAADAYDVLTKPFVDFPFADAWHQSAAVACLLTLIARPAIDGPVPLFCFTATTPKSGKSLLADVIHLVATGRDIARSAHVDSEEEQEKRITTFLLAGLPAVLIDNVDGALGGRALDAVLTGRQWMGRVLGASEAPTLPIRTVWMATGNNVAFRGDLAQRTIPIALEPEEERPERRTGFTIPRLREWAKRHRSQMLSAAFTLLRAHAQAGLPAPPGAFGGFEEWNETVRAALVWAGAPDPYQGVRQLAEVADERRNVLTGLMEVWAYRFHDQAVRLTDVIEAAERDEELREILLQIAADRTGKIDARALGNVLRRSAGRIYGGRRLVRHEMDRKGIGRWKVERVRS